MKTCFIQVSFLSEENKLNFGPPPQRRQVNRLSPILSTPLLYSSSILLCLHFEAVFSRRKPRKVCLYFFGGRPVGHVIPGRRPVPVIDLAEAAKMQGNPPDPEDRSVERRVQGRAGRVADALYVPTSISGDDTGAAWQSGRQERKTMTRAVFTRGAFPTKILKAGKMANF